VLALLLPCAERSPSLERTESWNLISELIENGADINAKTNAGDTALMMAAALGHGETLEYLLRKGADRSIRKNVRPPSSLTRCSPTCVHHRATRHATGLRACNERGAASGCLSLALARHVALEEAAVSGMCTPSSSRVRSSRNGYVTLRRELPLLILPSTRIFARVSRAAVRRCSP